MKTFMCFLKKEIIENVRNGKLVIIMVLSVFLGILAPATAKLMPELLKTLEGTGMTVNLGEITAFDSWQQYYKNAPIFVVVFLLMFAGTLVNEFNKSTLVLVVTKGLERWKIFIAKSLTLTIIWTLSYWIYYFITLFYTEYYWDNSVIYNCSFAALIYWIFGVVMISLMMLGSTLSSSAFGAVVIPGIVYFASMLLGIANSIEKYLLTKLTDAGCLLTEGITDYYPSIIIAAVIIAISYVIGIMAFNKKTI